MTIWNLNKLEILKIELENSDVDLVYANSTFIDENKNILNKKLLILHQIILVMII